MAYHHISLERKKSDLQIHKRAVLVEGEVLAWLKESAFLVSHVCSYPQTQLQLTCSKVKHQRKTHESETRDKATLYKERLANHKLAEEYFLSPHPQHTHSIR